MKVETYRSIQELSAVQEEIRATIKEHEELLADILKGESIDSIIDFEILEITQPMMYVLHLQHSLKYNSLQLEVFELTKILIGFKDDIALQLGTLTNMIRNLPAPVTLQ